MAVNVCCTDWVWLATVCPSIISITLGAGLPHAISLQCNLTVFLTHDIRSRDNFYIDVLTLCCCFCTVPSSSLNIESVISQNNRLLGTEGHDGWYYFALRFTCTYQHWNWDLIPALDEVYSIHLYMINNNFLYVLHFPPLIIPTQQLGLLKKMGVNRFKIWTLIVNVQLKSQF
jgi:hypothetical protein